MSLRAIFAIASIGLFCFCGVLIETAANVTFPTLMEEFDITTSTVQWMTTGNLLVMGIFIPISSFLKRRFPSYQLFMAAGIMFIIGLLIDILANSFGVLLVGRIIQGAGVGVALPLMYNIIIAESPKRIIGLMMGIGSFVTAAAPALGPTFGGTMIEYFSWRMIFITILPVIVLTLIVGTVTITRNKGDATEKMDVAGFIAIALTFTMFMFGFSNLDKIVSKPWLPIGCFIVGVIAVSIFIYFEKHQKQPLIQLKIFKNKIFVCHLVAVALFQVTTLGIGLLLANYYQIVQGYSAMKAGMLVLPGSIVGAIFAPVGGMILDRFGAKKPILFGGALTCLAVLLYLICLPHLNYVSGMCFYITYMFGLGLTVGNTLTRALGSLPEADSADGNAVLQTLQQLSGGIGTSIAAALLAFAQDKNDLAQTTQKGAQAVFIFLMLTILIAFILQIVAFAKKTEK